MDRDGDQGESAASSGSDRKHRPAKIIRRILLGGIVGLIWWTTLEIAFLPFGDIHELRHRNPTETAFMRWNDAHQTRQRSFPERRQYWVPLRQIPDHLKNAVIVAEDGRFWRHSGFDWFEVWESVERNVRERKLARGGSTITQQLVKNLYLSPSKNPLRKVKEWVLTSWMELTLPKSRILELYLNVIEWGEGIYGVEAASRRWFGKSVRDLTREESARLAAVIPNPKRFNPASDHPSLLRASQIILDRMAARGM
ncbi:MAG: monofunctional biosynthetic peptidoglycan transglycosylase [Bacteroidota bacterium]